MRKFPLALLLFLIGSCPILSNGQGQKDEQYSLLRSNGLIDPNAKGVWRSIGDGYLLDATADSIYLYSYTDNFCYKEKNDFIVDRLNSQARFRRLGDTLRVLSGDFGNKSEHLQTTRDFVKIDRLPQRAISHEAMQQLPANSLFALFIETLSENYAFSRERKLDWPAIRQSFGKQISAATSREELFRILGQIVTLTKDHHTKIIAKDGATLQYGRTPSADLLIEAFKQQTDVKQLNDYFNRFFTTNYKHISDSLLHGRGQKLANGQIEWGSLTDKVGYIHFHSFTNFAPQGISRRQQIDSINVCMERILGKLNTKEAIILDVSFNFGGYDAAVLSIASFFADRTRLAYTSQVFANGAFYEESKLHVRPSVSITYTKPVYVLMSDISRSAAEGFAMTMKALPHVQLVGTPTLGILSGMLGKSIGDYYLTLSNQRLLSPTDQYYEVRGVQPDVFMEVFPKANLFEGHKEAVRKILRLINK